MVATSFRRRSLQRSGGVRPVIAALIQQLYYLLPDAGLRMAARAAVDTELADDARAQVTAGATVMVAGISDIASGQAHLHYFGISGPGWGHTELRSSAAGRAPYVQLIDIAPTILTPSGT